MDAYRKQPRQVELIPDGQRWIVRVRFHPLLPAQDYSCGNLALARNVREALLPRGPLQELSSALQ
jgi:hypothetical protein